MLRIVVTFGSCGDSMNKSNWEVVPLKSFCRSYFSAVIQSPKSKPCAYPPRSKSW